MLGIPVEIVLLVVALGLFVLTGVTIKSRYILVPPNEAIIVVGGKGKSGGSDAPQKVVTSGGVLVWPFFQQAHRVSLETMKIALEVHRVPTSNKVLINLDATANVKVGSSEEEINNAGQRFLSWSNSDKESNVNEILSGSARAIIGKMSVEQIIEDRDSFAGAVQEIAAKELQAMGLVIDVMNVKEITDENEPSYIESLGVPQVQEIVKTAEIAKYKASLEITESEQETELRKAEVVKNTEVERANYQAEQDTALARADQAGPLASAEAQKQVVEQQTVVASLEAEKVEKELEATIKKPADANAYEAKVRAAGEREATIERAEAEKQRLTLEGAGTAARKMAEGNAAADVEKARGLAEAEVMEAKARAEGAEVREVALAKAEGQMKEAEALNAMHDASMDLKRLEIMPVVARELASQLGSIKGLTLAGKGGVGDFLSLFPTLLDQVGDIVHGPSMNGESPNGQSNEPKPKAPEAKRVTVPTPKKKLDMTPLEIEPETKTISGALGSDVAKQIAKALAGAAGDDLAAKLTDLRKKGGRALDFMVDSKSIDKIIAIAETVDGPLDSQVGAVLDAIDADQDLKDAASKLLPFITEFGPRLGDIPQPN